MPSKMFGISASSCIVIDRGHEDTFGANGRIIHDMNISNTVG